MIVTRCKDYNDLSVITAQIIVDIVMNKPASLLCFPAGETSVGTFNELIKLQSKGEIDFSKCKIVGLDEWVKLGEMKQENCYHFLKSKLFTHLDIPKENICFFNGEADNLQYECSRTDEFIKHNNGIDMMLLGVGMNGHLGLNEPGVSFDKYSHVVELDEVTRNVAQKYFSQPVILSKGITLGVQHIMEAKTIIVQLSGKKKAPIVKRLLEDETVTPGLPVSVIKKHKNAFLVIDKEADPLKP